MAVVSPPSKEETNAAEVAVDQLELEAALSAACLSSDSTEVNSNQKSSNKRDDGTLEVSYNEGGTPLFTKLELCEWQHALDLCTEESVRTWVKSTGTSNTTFGWSMWRRLPIHEAARRQAPAWLLVKMLSLYPESASQTTHFGELPLHVAVETGSTPEVIHLLLTAYMRGVECRDKSGRTPLDICKENEYPDPLVLESLETATRNHWILQQEWQDKIHSLQEKHKQAMQELQNQHLKELEKEYQTQQQLKEALEMGHSSVEEMLQQQSLVKAQAHESEQESNIWKARAMAFQEELIQLEQTHDRQTEEMQHLQEELKDRDATIDRLNECIATLSNDLTNCLVFHRDIVLKSVNKANEDIKTMMKSQEALQGHLIGNVRGMELLLESRGIVVPPPPQPPKTKEVPVVDTTAAVRVASQVAFKALEVSNAKQGYV